MRAFLSWPSATCTTPPDGHLTVDIDLGILGSSPASFETYDRNICREYDWVPEDDNVQGRIRILQQFLERSEIYRTPEIRDAFEEQARAKQKAKLADLVT